MCDKFNTTDMNIFGNYYYKKCDVNHDEYYRNYLIKNPQFIRRTNWMHTCYKCDNATNNENIRLQMLFHLDKKFISSE